MDIHLHGTYRTFVTSLLVHATVFNHYHRIKMLCQFTKLSAVSSAFLSVTSSLDGVRDDRER